MNEMPKPVWMSGTRDKEMWLRCVTAVRLRCLTPEQAKWLYQNVWIHSTWPDDHEVRNYIAGKWNENVI